LFKITKCQQHVFFNPKGGGLGGVKRRKIHTT
jgi:hypothetical protein